MKIAGLGVLVLLLFSVPALAHSSDDLVDPGIGPNSFLYKIDLGLESIRLILTFDRKEKINILLERIDERLAEIDKALDDDKDATKAIQAHKKSIEKIDKQLSKFKDKEDEIEFIGKVADKLADHAGIIEVYQDIHPDEEKLADLFAQSDELFKTVSEREVEIGGDREDVAAKDNDSKDKKEEAKEDSDDKSGEVGEKEEVDDSAKVNIQIVAVVGDSSSEVTVSGDRELVFDFNVTDTEELVEELTFLLDMSEDEITNSLTVELLYLKPKILGRLPGNEISRITIVEDGEETEIVLSITDKKSIIKEVSKRIGWSVEDVTSLIVWEED